MSRLIDADALIAKCGEWYTDEGTEEGFIGTLGSLLDAAHTIPAIPVSWLQEKIRSEYEPDSKAALRVLRMWEKEAR